MLAGSAFITVAKVSYTSISCSEVFTFSAYDQCTF